MSMSELLALIADYCERTSTAPSTFGRRALGDPGFVARLQSGGQCLPRTMDRVRAYMAENPSGARKAASTPEPEADAA